MQKFDNFRVLITKFVGLIFIFVGLILAYDAIQLFNDDSVSVVLNGGERNDKEAKLSLLFMPATLIIVGILVQKISTGTFSVIRKMRAIERQIWRR